MSLPLILNQMQTSSFFLKIVSIFMNEDLEIMLNTNY